MPPEIPRTPHPGPAGVLTAYRMPALGRCGWAAIAIAAIPLLGCDGTAMGGTEGPVIEVVAEASRWQLVNPDLAVDIMAGHAVVLSGGTVLGVPLTPVAAPETLCVAESPDCGLRRPRAVASLGDGTFGVADWDRGELVVLDTAGRELRALPFPDGARRLVLDPERERGFALTYGPTGRFSIEANRADIPEDALVSVVSLRDGEIRDRLFEVHPAEDPFLHLFNNRVRLALDGRYGHLWVAWPYETGIARVGHDGQVLERISRTVDATRFAPTAGASLPSSSGKTVVKPPHPIVNVALAVGPGGRLLVLTETPSGAPAGASEADARSWVEVVEGGSVVCRTPLPFLASAMAFLPPDRLLVAGEGLYLVRPYCSPLRASDAE